MVNVHEPAGTEMVAACVQLTNRQLLGLRLSAPPLRVKMNQSPAVDVVPMFQLTSTGVPELAVDGELAMLARLAALVTVAVLVGDPAGMVSGADMASRL
jgi:hypothetical protein